MRLPTLAAVLLLSPPVAVIAQDYVPPTFSEWERISDHWTGQVLSGGLEGRLNVWEYGIWSSNTGGGAGVATENVSGPLMGARLSIQCRYVDEKWDLRVGLNYRLESGWYSLDLAGSGPQGRPAAMFIDGEVYDNTGIEPGSAEHALYMQEIYQAISTSSSASIPVRFMDSREDMMLGAEFSMFQKERALLIVNKLCPL